MTHISKPKIKKKFLSWWIAIMPLESAPHIIHGNWGNERTIWTKPRFVRLGTSRVGIWRVQVTFSSVQVQLYWMLLGWKGKTCPPQCPPPIFVWPSIPGLGAGITASLVLLAVSYFLVIGWLLLFPLEFHHLTPLLNNNPASDPPLQWQKTINLATPRSPGASPLAVNSNHSTWDLSTKILIGRYP